MGSCNRRNEDIPIIPPENPPLSRQLIGYGVINVSYTHVVEKADGTAPSLGYLRRGDIVKVIERRQIINRTPVSPAAAGTGERAPPEDTVESWVLAEGNFRGWLLESMVDIYDNESQAETAHRSMSQ